MSSHSIQVLQRAWPIILANASVPLLGLIDTAVIGRFGSTAELAGLAAVNLIFNLLYWSFGFLRMATTGFVAQASGRGDTREIRLVCLRMATIALTVGVLLVVAQALVAPLAFAALQASAAVEFQADLYFRIRIWGAPAALFLYVLMGLLIGLGRSRALLAVQVALNLTNIILDVVLVVLADRGLVGVAVGTVVAEWLFASAAAVVLAWRWSRGGKGAAFTDWRAAFARSALASTLSANGDLFIRTLCLLLGFGWFLNRSAHYGDVTLAANHLLLTIISFCAFFLDAFAYVAEADVGKALGSRSRTDFNRSVRSTSTCAGGSAALLAVGVALTGEMAIGWLTTIESVRSTATALLPWVSLYVAVSVAAFQLDGIFIGASETRALRNASIVSLFLFLCLSYWLSSQDAGGLWLSFMCYVIARACCLLAYYPKLLTRF